MAWSVEFRATAKRQLAKLDRQRQAAILDYIEDRIAPLDNPRNRGEPLIGDRKGLWRYRVGDCRILYWSRSTNGNANPTRVASRSMWC